MFTAEDFVDVIRYLGNGRFTPEEASRIFNEAPYNEDNFKYTLGYHIYDKWISRLNYCGGTGNEFESIGWFIACFDYETLEIFINGIKEYYKKV